MGDPVLSWQKKLNDVLFKTMLFPCAEKYHSYMKANHSEGNVKMSYSQRRYLERLLAYQKHCQNMFAISQMGNTVFQVLQLRAQAKPVDPLLP